MQYSTLLLYRNFHVHSKRFIIFVLLFSFSQLIFAVTRYPSHGFYLGLLTGYGEVDYHKTLSTAGIQTATVQDSGLSPNLMLGYRFNQYVASELGIVYFAKPKINNTKFKNNLVYLTGKLSVPLYHGLSMFTKLGIGYEVRDRVELNSQTVLIGNEFFTTVYGAGVNWQAARHWLLEVTWLQTPQQSRHKLPRANFYGVGASYLF